MFEHHKKPLLPRREYAKRLAATFGIAGLIVAFALGLGVFGYHYFAEIDWLDSLLNASMILTGMGPVNEMVSPPAKLFASFYALFSGIVFLSTIVVVLAPIVHRFLHRFHLGDDSTS